HARTAVARVRQQAHGLSGICAQELERGQRQPEALCVGALRSVEHLRRDAHNGKGHSVNAEHAANDRGIACKMMLPESVADNRDSLWTPDTILVRQKPPAVQHVNAEHIEIIAADERERRLTLYLLVPQAGTALPPRDQPRECSRAVVQIAVFGNAESARPSSSGGGVDIMRRDDATGIGHGPGTQGDGVEEREEAGVQADTQDQNRAGGDREAWLAAQAAQGVANVLLQAVEPDGNPDLPRAFARTRDAA